MFLRGALVYVNDYLTKQKGTDRSYVSRQLKQNQLYEYQVRAVMYVKGQRIERTESVKLMAGEASELAFDFTPPETTLTVNVPQRCQGLPGRE